MGGEPGASRGSRRSGAGDGDARTSRSLLILRAWLTSPRLDRYSPNGSLATLEDCQCRTSAHVRQPLVKEAWLKRDWSEAETRGLGPEHSLLYLSHIPPSPEGEERSSEYWTTVFAFAIHFQTYRFGTNTDCDQRWFEPEESSSEPQSWMQSECNLIVIGDAWIRIRELQWISVLIPECNLNAIWLQSEMLWFCETVLQVVERWVELRLIVLSKKSARYLYFDLRNRQQ